jgi:hypothetical protein
MTPDENLRVSARRSENGEQYVERTPMNWGRNLTLLGAMRLSGWVVLSTMFASTNKARFAVRPCRCHARDFRELVCVSKLMAVRGRSTYEIAFAWSRGKFTVTSDVTRRPRLSSGGPMHAARRM